jgi:hypothetical protein
MNKKNKEKIKIIINHCEMFLYGTSVNPFLFLYSENPEISAKYNNFCLINLVSAMFLVRDNKEKEDKHAGGFFYRLLKPLNYNYLLNPIEKLMKASVGETTFGDYQRKMRNNLCVHGDFSRESLLEAEKNLIYSEEGNKKFNSLFEELICEVNILKKELEKLI